MHILARSVWLPKAGNSFAEYEDACCPAESIETDTSVFHCAVADGATETSFADIWAGLLAKAYGEGQLLEPDLIQALMPLQESWSEHLNTKTLPWYAAEKASNGAFSTLLGLTIDQDEWSATAVGDSCLFQIRRDELITAFPLDSAAHFNNRPFLFSSNPAFNDRAMESLAEQTGLWEPDDEFLLMTDALACWFLASVENKPWRQLREFTQPNCSEGFTRLIDEIRRASLMRNDDVTLLRIEIN